MLKKQLVREMAQESELSQKTCAQALDAFLTVVTSSLIDGEEVNISGFGKFISSVQAPRSARNPATGETFMTDEKLRVKFRPSLTLKRYVNSEE